MVLLVQLILSLISTLGTGYQVGEVLTIDNSSNLVTSGNGFKLVVTSIELHLIHYS